MRADDAEAIWQITRQPGLIQTILALPSDRVGQRSGVLARLSNNDHYFVAEIDAQLVGFAGLIVGSGRLRSNKHVFLFVGQGIRAGAVVRRGLSRC